jgi:hypothetical protein
MSLRFGTVVLLGASALIADAGCETRCNVSCAEAGAIVDKRALTAPIVSVRADPPCTVNQALLDDGGSDGEVSVEVNGTGSGSCEIHATIADGSTWVAVLSWAFGSTGPCCPNVTYNVGPAPAFTRGNDGVDAARDP